MIDTRAEHYEAMSWCLKNNIKVYPKLRGAKYILVHTVDGVAYSSGKEYDVKEYQQVIWEYYLYLFNEFKNVSS